MADSRAHTTLSSLAPLSLGGLRQRDTKHIRRIPFLVSLSMENTFVDVSGMGYAPSFERFR